MDNEMIERVAKALWDLEQSSFYIQYGFSNSLLFGEQWHKRAVPWEYLLNSETVIPSIAEEWKNKARAAIKAMREPTEKMMQAGGMYLPDYSPSDEDAKICWHNMIDCIIE